MIRDNDRSNAVSLASADARGQKTRYARVMLGACFLITSLTYAGTYSFGLFFNPLRTEFGWSSAQTSGIYSLFMLCYCLFGIFAGLFVDILGPRATVVAGAFCLGAGLLLSSIVQELWQIYLTFGVLCGAGMSSVYSPVMATVSRWFPRRQGLALGWVTSGMGLGIFVGPHIFGHLIPTRGWRFSYLAAGIAIGSSMAVLGLLLRKNPTQADGRCEKKKDYGARGTGVNEWSVLEVVCTGLFWLFAAVFFMVGFGLQMMLAHLIPYMQKTYEFSPSAAGAIFSVIGIASAAARIIMGGVSEYLGPRKSLNIAVMLEGLAIVLIILSPRPWMLYPFAALLGFGYGGHSPQFPAIIRGLFGTRRVGRNIGLLQIFYGSGALVGPILAGWMFDRAGSYAAPFAIAAGLMFLAGWLSLSLKRPAEWI